MIAQFFDKNRSSLQHHNAQAGRSGGNCAGRSFDETFADSLADDGTIIRRATEAQRALWLLAAENVRCKKGSGEIHFNGNRYWNAALNQYAGQKVTLRFDPDNLHQPVRVYDLDNRLICVADCIEDTGFYDADAARRHNTARKSYLKGLAAQQAAVAAMRPEELADIYRRGAPKQAEKPAPKPKITRLMPGAGKDAQKRQETAAMSAAEFEAGFAAAMAGLGKKYG